MLVRLVGKLLFKACVPLLLVAGIATYGIYLKGGDPSALWGRVASGAFDTAGSMLTKAKNDAAYVADNLANTANDSSFAASNAGHTEAFKWVDADGVTHYSNTSPQGISARSIRVDPNTNVLEPVAAPVVSGDDSSYGEHGTSSESAPQLAGTERGPAAAASDARQAARLFESQNKIPLPGVAGQLLSGDSSGGNGLDATQLIRFLQSASD